MLPTLVKGAAEAGRLAVGAMTKKATPVLTAAFSTSSAPPPSPPPPPELKNSTQLSIGERKMPKMPSLTPPPTFVRGPVMGLSSGDILPIWPWACQVNFEPKFDPANIDTYHKIIDKLPEHLMQKAMALLTKFQERENVNLNAWSYKEKGTFKFNYCSESSCKIITTDSRFSIWVRIPGPGLDGLKKMEKILKLGRLFSNSAEGASPFGPYDTCFRAHKIHKNTR